MLRAVYPVEYTSIWRIRCKTSASREVITGNLNICVVNVRKVDLQLVGKRAAQG